ncbi:unnamed protein product [Diplocarpon coronariae]|uniref:Uncharacterized protein n=1 Tax=Diplocarpon coronariae TaxID=2795749 RepID=A0A218YZ17_9HELO|nr:hypothetical protein B2J93_305 [Marssonina coronariae]
MGSDKAKPAYCEDVDASSGRPVRGSRKSAAVKPKVSHQEEPGREGRKSGKHRKSQLDALAIYPSGHRTSAAQHVEIARDMKLERRQSASNTTHSPRKIHRPPSATENRSFPGLDFPSTSNKTRNPDTAVPTMTRSPAAVSQPIPFRPRPVPAQAYPRPLSYQAQTPSGGHGPPLSMSAYYQQHPATPSFPPPSSSSSYMQYAAPQEVQFPQGQYAPQAQYQYAPPPPQPYASPQQQYPASAQAQYSSGQGDSYFAPKASSRPLSARFDPVPRSSTAFEPATQKSSAFGGRDIRSRAPSDYDSAYNDDGYASAADGATIRKRERRSSIRVPPSTSTMSRAEADFLAMPPPSRPAGILRKSTEPPHDPRSDQGVLGYCERDEVSEYREERPRRPSVSRHSASYDVGGVRVEAANSSRRRESQYDMSSSSGGSSGYDGQSYDSKSTYETKTSQAQALQEASSAYDAKFNQAQAYQEDVSGGPTIPLTAEVLRRQQRKQEGSSRSTKSSASRDESDYKKSVTTRTTRSGSGDNEESVTIKLVGQARVMVGGTQIDCTEGGEIQIQRQKSLPGGSERSVSEYGTRRIEDRQSRVSRPAGRSRMSSSRESYTRTPEYPRPRERGRDDSYF